jgi:hypothetical protein
MAEERDNRINLGPTEVDFEDEVGTTGQKHDDFPQAGHQPRYDWMRIYLIGLLSLQSSESRPTEYRTGTLWYNRTTNIVEIYNGSDWTDLSEHISMEESGGEILTLAEWFAEAQPKINAIQPRYSFSGESEESNITVIPVPESIQTEIDGIDGMRPFVYKNGSLIDPRNSSFGGSSATIVLSGGAELDEGDLFTVVIEKVDVFVTETIVVR